METQESDDLMCIEVQINSVVQSDEKQLASRENSPPKPIKRKNHDVLEDAFPNVHRPPDLRKEFSNYDSFDECSKSHTKKMKRRSMTKKSNLHVCPTERKNEEIDNILARTTELYPMTASNLKNIVRHVITNEYVLAIVRSIIKAEGRDGNDLEPIMTRSKVRELHEKQHMLQWPVSVPIKEATPELKALLEEEFADECSSDKDYEPDEEEFSSEEDTEANPSKSEKLDPFVCEKPAVPVTKHEGNVDEKMGLTLPKNESEDISFDSEVDRIALRTRSKLPLNETLIEAIESSFIAPDITTDMYDTHCEDEEWQKFLQELSQTLIKTSDEELDDWEEDPEYKAIENDDVPDQFELCFENNITFTRKELNELIAEIYNQPLFHDVEEDVDGEVSARIDIPISDVVNAQTEWRMTLEERLQLEHQMRMHIQVLTQSYLLSFGIPELDYINISSKLFLDEIKMFASHSNTVNECSAFYAHNLDGALDIVNEYENNRNRYHVQSDIFSSNKGFADIPCYHVKKTLFDNKVFIYTQLLPTCGFIRSVENKKAVFTAAEDNLVALGLEQFSLYKSPVYYIQLFLVPTKTEEQIKVRIKNSKSTKGSSENPIKYYFVHKTAPPVPRTIELFDPAKVKAPKDRPVEILPKWMRQMHPLPVTLGVQRILPKAPKPSIPVHIVKQHSPKQRYRKLLPRNVNFSPLKQISPILKKYNQKRFLSSPKDHSTRKSRTVQFAKKLAIKTPLISPKPVRNIEKIIEKEIIENDNLRKSISSNVEIKNLNTSVIAKSKKSSQDPFDGTCIENSEISKISTGIVDLSANDCELEVADEGDEEIIDDELEVSAPHDSVLTNSIINKKCSSNKKKNKQQRDLEASLALLQPDFLEKDPKREERENLFVNSYLLRVTEALKEDTDACEKFLNILCKQQPSVQTPVKVYLEIKEILKDYPALANDFIAFLSSEQAKECGKYKEYITLSKIRAFIRKIEIHFRNQPQHLLKILRLFAQFKQQCSITSAEVLGILQPILKNQSHLMEELICLLPEMAPSENLMTDFEEVNLPNSDDDNSSVSSCEEIQIPDAPDLYGGKDCPCECHISSTEAKVLSKIRHCVKCGVKFMDGRIYIQTGKVLKPAQVIYCDTPPEPVKITNGDLKTFTKNKQFNCSSSQKNPMVSDQSIKSEISLVKKDLVKALTVIQQPVTSSEEPISNKDPVKSPAVTPNPVLLSDEPVPSTPKLLCDVIEDTIFPALPVVSNKNVPPDFSHLSDVIRLTKDKGSCPNEKFISDNQTEVISTTEEANHPPSISNQTVRWTREEDKLIIYNCQRFGVTEKAFEASSSILKSKTAKEVQERFIFVMNLLTRLKYAGNEHKVNV